MTKISFIIIGKNEGWKITQCVESVYNAISINNYTDCELIYVDSKSSDDSISRAKAFPELKIFQITGECNAAVARNIGAAESTGDILFFLDGDMEIQSNFVRIALSLFQKGHKFFSGQVEECFYNESWEVIGSRKVFAENKLNKYDQTNGGAMIIDKSLWELVQGMRTKYDRSEDIDLTYRLVKNGYPIYRAKEIFVVHHTIQYNYNTNLLAEFNNFRSYLFKGLLIREHLLNYKVFRRTIRINYALFLLLFSIIALAIFNTVLIIIPYIILISYRSFRQYNRFKNVAKANYFITLFKSLFIDFCGIIGILLFYPKNKSVKYKPIQ